MILLSSCTQRTQEAKGYQTVKIDTIVSADKQTFLQFPGKVKAAQDISLAFRGSSNQRILNLKDTLESGSVKLLEIGSGRI